MGQVSAEQITIDPEDISIGFTAGSTTTVPINISWDGKDPIEIDLEGGASEGIYVSYEPNPVFVSSTTQVNMTIKTSMLLMPDFYTITTKATGHVEADEPTIPPSNPPSDSIHWTGTRTEEPTEPPVVEEDDALETGSVSFSSEEFIDMGPEYKEQSESESSFSFAPFGVLLIVLGSIILVAVAWKKKHEK